MTTAIKYNRGTGKSRKKNMSSKDIVNYQVVTGGMRDEATKRRNKAKAKKRRKKA